jgi:hypothetical protein
MWCQVSAIDDYVLLFTEGALMGNSSSRPGYLEALIKLDLEMRRDARFQNIRWYRWRGPEGPGATTPVDVELDQLPKPTPRRDWFSWARRKPYAGS